MNLISILFSFINLRKINILCVKKIFLCNKIRSILFDKKPSFELYSRYVFVKSIEVVDLFRFSVQLA